MEKFTVHIGRGLPLRRSNVDTDQIIPAEYLKRITRTGFADGLFAAWRKDPSFVLNDERFRDASILIAGPDFGIGSSREHAVWALQDYGFRCEISARFGDIHRSNAYQAGLLPVQLPGDVVTQLQDIVEAAPDMQISVDLDRREVRCADIVAPFDIDDYTRWRLMEGLDDIALTLQNTGAIEDFEARRPTWLPVTT